MSEHSLSASGQTYNQWAGQYRLNGTKVEGLENWYIEPALDWNNTRAVEDYWRAHSTDKTICFSKVCFAAARGQLPSVNDNGNSNPTETDAEAQMATITDAANIFDNALARAGRTDNGSAPTIPFDPNRAPGIGQLGPVTTQPNALGVGLMVAAIIWLIRRVI